MVGLVLAAGLVLAVGAGLVVGAGPVVGAGLVVRAGLACRGGHDFTGGAVAWIHVVGGGRAGQSRPGLWWWSRFKLIFLTVVW